MKTMVKNNNRRKAGKIIRLGEKPDGELARKMVPGKSLEQIRLDTVRQLREAGIFF